MTPPARPKRTHDTTILWLACLVVLCAGYYIAFYRLGAAIDLQADLAARVASSARANQQLLAAGPLFERTEAALDGQITALGLQADHTTTVARFIREFARLAAKHRVRLVGIDERSMQGADVHLAQRSAESAAFEAIPLDVTLSGSYRDVLATIRDVAQAPLAIAIDVAAIDRGTTVDAGARNAALTARLRVTVEHFADAAPPATTSAIYPEETTHARPL